MVFRITPSLGPDVEQVITAPAFYDGGNVTSPSYQLGSVVRGSDGGEYMFVKASANISGTADTGTRVILTYSDKTVATGSGDWYTPPDTAVLKDQFLHVRKGAWNAAPA